MKIDLHMHSTVSDGSLSPCELAEACKEAGLSHAALTDHDTQGGVSEYLSAARDLGLCAISGMEFTVQYDGELHILGYGFDEKHPALVARLAELAHEREERVAQMVYKLQKEGYRISLEKVREIAGDGVMGRPHIATALYLAGYAPGQEEAYRTFLEPGKPGWVIRRKISSEEAISLIRNAGGEAVWAHPMQAHYHDDDEMAARLTSEGLGGIEAYYPAHSDDDVAKYLALADKYGLFVTQGSDYHGGMRHGTAISKETRGSHRLREDVSALFARHRHTLGERL